MYDYLITQDRIRLNFHSALINRKDTVLYSCRLVPAKAEAYYAFIKPLRIDTLQNSYGNGIDGLSTSFSIQGDSLTKKTINTEGAFKHPIIKTIVDKTNELIDNRDFAFKRY